MSTRAGAECSRASYILERGVWRATCRTCGWQATHEQRRKANGLFRNHMQDQRALVSPPLTARPEGVIDLTTGARPGPGIALGAS